ncbi:MAG TPA: PIN domain-containing protein [Agitococcus sp.]|nr:PIN domain-containing protein [Agitococcus sp.]
MDSTLLPTVNQTQILLIDLENCPSQLSVLLKDLEQYQQVIICYAQTGAKIPLDWLMPLNEMINQHRLKIIKMPNTGKNAADFGICFLAGMLMAEQPQNTHFVIVSDDTDLDHTIKLLKSYGRTAERISLKKEEVTTTIVNIKETTLKGYCQKLIVQQKNRPSSKTSLLNSLRSYYGQDLNAAESSFNQLLELGLITLTANNKVTYHDNNISQYAA